MAKRKCKTCRGFGLLENGPCPKGCIPNPLGKRLGGHGKAFEVRLNEDKTLDEVVAGHPAKLSEKQTDLFFHLEQMSDSHWWMGITMKDGQTIHVNLHTKQAKIYANCEIDP